MSVSKIIFYPVDNGGMALLKLNDPNYTTFLIDLHIRASADDEEDDSVYDVSNHLRKELSTNSDGRPFINSFLITHNDDDHVKGLEKHFHLGSIEDYKEPDEDDQKKIVINEILSSARFWKRANHSNKLCDDAKALNREMKRRIQLYKDTYEIQKASDRAIIICEDDDGKTDDLTDIVIPIDSVFSTIDDTNLSSKISIRVLGPLPKQDGEEDDDYNEKNRGSVIIQIIVKEGSYENKLILPGDAELFVWEKLWEKFEDDTDKLEYDVLLCPHHCSWHSMGTGSRSKGEELVLSVDAFSALSQNKDGAYIISSSKPIKKEDSDPPSPEAKKEYVKIVTSDHFKCTGEYPKVNNIEPIVINLTKLGPQLQQLKAQSKLHKGALGGVGEAYPHG